MIKVSWFSTIGLITSSGFVEFMYITLGFFAVYFVIPLLWEGKTIGTYIMRYKLTVFVGNAPSWKSLLKRFFALYLPWIVSTFLKILSGIELSMSSKLYPIHVWATITVMAFLFIMWVALFIHAIIIIVKKGTRTFYFDYVADIVPRR